MIVEIVTRVAKGVNKVSAVSQQPSGAAKGIRVVVATGSKFGAIFTRIALSFANFFVVSAPAVALAGASCLPNHHDVFADFRSRTAREPASWHHFRLHNQ